MNTVFLLTGGNLGDRNKNLQKAVELIAQQIGKIENISAVFETVAWGTHDQPDYLNQALQVTTYLTPQELLKAILSIEKNMGRLRSSKWEPRVIDIDVLLYNDLVVDDPALTIPHPLLHKRRFALVPLAELAPELIHPVMKQPIRELLQHCPDELTVKKFSLTPF